MDELPTKRDWQVTPSSAIEGTDEALFEGFREGDDRMLEALIQRYEGPLYGFLLKTTGNPTAAAELFQDAWVRVCGKAASYQAGRPFKAWLYQVALNLARDRFRQEGRAPLPLMEEALAGTAGGTSPAEELEKREQAGALARAVGELPEAQRQVFLLRHDGELSFEAIAEAVGRPLNTVKSDMRRGLAKLRALLTRGEEAP